jgi:hypothetical protein
LRISLIIDKPYQENRIFDENDLVINRDDCQRPLIELKRKLEQNHISLNTVDVTPVSSCDLALFINVPDPEDEYFKEVLELNKTCYVIINELTMILPQNNSHEMHSHFMRIFTYQQQLVDNRKIFKTNYSFNFSQKVERFKPVKCADKKLCTLIAGYKKLDHPLELYSERINTIRWFEKNHPSEFDLYGQGWNQYGFLRSLITRKFPSYKSPIVEKQQVLSQYKFNICYENAKNVPGWITEKIFDSFFAGTVPVYWGWKGVSNYIPSNCFIDREHFKNHDELYSYMSSMSITEYEGYINNIFSFLENVKSDINYEFSVPYFVNTIEREILKHFNH